MEENKELNKSVEENKEIDKHIEENKKIDKPEEENRKIDKFEEDNILFVELYADHPFAFERNISSSAHYIKHADDECGGQIYIGDNAKFKCRKCNAVDHISKWKYINIEDGFNLSLTDGDPITTLVELMSFASQMTTDAGLPWLKKFMDNLE